MAPNKTEKKDASAAPDGDYVRGLQTEDVRFVKMLVGAGIMEGLAIANRMVLRNLLTLALILGLGLVLNQMLGFKPQPQLFRITYLAPLVGPAFAGLPILGAIEYLNRWPFTALMRGVLGGVDILSPEAYYAPRDGNGAWVFEHNGEIVGFVALDRKRAGRAVQSVLRDDEGEVAAPGSVDVDAPLRQAKRSSSNSSSSAIAEIRHLTVNAPLRGFGIGKELVAAALDDAFASEKTEQVVVLTSPFTTGGERLFNRCGFRPLPERLIAEHSLRASEPVGRLVSARGRWLAVDRPGWTAARARVFAQARK